MDTTQTFELPDFEENRKIFAEYEKFRGEGKKVKEEETKPKEGKKVKEEESKSKESKEVKEEESKSKKSKEVEEDDSQRMERIYASAKKYNDEAEKYCKDLTECFRDNKHPDLEIKWPKKMTLTIVPATREMDLSKSEKIIRTLNLYRGFQEEAIEVQRTFYAATEDEKEYAMSLFRLWSTRPPSWVCGDYKNEELIKFVDVLKGTPKRFGAMLTANLLENWKPRIYHNYSALFSAITDVKTQHFKEIVSDLKSVLNCLEIYWRDFTESWSKQKRVAEINATLKTNADFSDLVERTRAQVVDKGNFDGMLWDELTHGCLSSAYLAISEQIDMPLYMREIPKSSETKEKEIKELLADQVRQMIAERVYKLPKQGNIVGYVYLLELYKSRLGLPFEEKFLDEKSRRDFIRMYEHHPEVQNMGHTGMSMYWTANELKHIFSLGWTKYITTRFQGMGIGTHLR